MADKDPYAAGRALRDKVSRQSHATWKPPANRRDPVDLLIRSSAGRVPELIPIRYGRMMQTPFAFFRGAAAIMAADLARTPSTGIRLQACGDCHLVNFGGFATPERRIVFDINDFDETLPAPWEWDVKRLATSFVVCGRHNRFNRSAARDVAERVVRSYRQHMGRYAGMRVLERWYERIEIDDLIDTLVSRKWKRWMRKQVDKAESVTVVNEDFPKLVTVSHGTPRIKDNPPLIFHQAAAGTKAYHRLLMNAFRRYRGTLADDRRVLADRYKIRDVAVKVVGVGSVGTRCAIILMMAGDDDALFLQVKEASASVLAPYVGKSRYANQGERVVVGQRLMQAASDLFLGWTVEGGRDFYVRQLHDVKIKPLVEVADVAYLQRYAQWCGWALARAHAKSGNAAAIAGYLGTSGRFDDAVANFAMAYADQNERDYRAMLKAVRDRKLPVIEE